MRFVPRAPHWSKFMNPDGSVSDVCVATVGQCPIRRVNVGDMAAAHIS
jgi:hypothetical protein